MLQLQLSALNCKGSTGCTSYAATSATNMDSGYPLDWFSEPVQSELICEICGKVLHSPRATPCGHTFCLRCVEFWIEYYGICPKRCGEIDLDGLRREPQVEKSVMSLFVHCKYSVYGCKVQPTLAEKQKHEKKCIYKSKLDKSPLHSAVVKLSETGKPLSLSQDTYVEMASVAGNRARAGSVESSRINLHPSSATTPELAYHTYHLTRKTPGESLGFVLVAGAKNSNGKAVNFSIKTVNPGTVAAEVGLLPGDKILQVDHIPLSQMSQQEAVSRIKDNPQVIITVLRAHKKLPKLEDHIYEDILYSDIAQQQQQENIPQHHSHSHDRIKEMSSRLHRKKSDPFPNRLHPPGDAHHLSPTYGSDPPRKILSEKMSADSGLSSSNSSFSPPHNASKERNRTLSDSARHHHSYRAERDRRHEGRISRGSTGEPSPLSRNIKIEGNYEVEEIFLQKNGTNQLGITLGYDTSLSTGSLFVCEIISTGLAAKDGRIRRGDIIRKVNGFEVYDPEEAVLLFLEQDQDISLTVARKIKPFRKGLMSSKSQSSLHSPMAALEEDKLRRTDSCGSLDSHNYGTQVNDEKSVRRTSEPAVMKRLVSPIPRVVSPGASPNTSLASTDFVFRPIKEGRPATAGELPPNPRLMRSSTSLGSAPEASRSSVQALNHPMAARHYSLETNRIRSVSPVKYPSPISGYRPRDIVTVRGDKVSPTDRMYRSVSNVRCESLV